MAHRRLVAAIADNQREGTKSSLCMYNEDLRSKHFKIAAKKELMDNGIRLGRCDKGLDITSTRPRDFLERNIKQYHNSMLDLLSDLF